MGAAVLSTLAAMRSGAGYVTLASTKEVCRTVLPMLPEAVLLPLAQNPDGSLSYKAMDALLEAAERSTAVLVGNGLGTGRTPAASSTSSCGGSPARSSSTRMV